VYTIPLVLVILFKYNLNIETDSDGDPTSVVLHDRISDSLFGNCYRGKELRMTFANSSSAIFKLSKTQKTIIAVLFFCLAVCGLLLVPAIQNHIVFIVEKFVLNRPLNNPKGALLMLKTASLLGIGIIAVLFFFVALFSKPDKVEKMIRRFIGMKAGSAEIGWIIGEQPFLLISCMFTLYLVKNIFLVCHITGFNIPVILVSLLSHVFICFLLYKRNRKPVLVSLAVCYLIIAFSLLLNSFIYDYSWDGQAYHQTAALYLSNGWNPFYSSLPETSVFIWDNHYPKFTWIYSAIFYSVSGNIELGKSYNIIFFIIVLIYALKLAGKYQKNKLAVLAVSVCFAVNPVALAQMFTYYVDGLMGMVIIILFFALMDYESKDYTSGEHKRDEGLMENHTA
jgi:hypothetical protein